MTIDAIRSSLVPQPKEVCPQQGRLELDATAPVAADFADVAKLSYLLRLCRQQQEPIVAPSPNAASDVLRLAIGETDVAGLSDLVPTFDGDEAYALRIGSRAVGLASRTLSGMALGLKTLAKLIHNQDSLPAMTIQDAPAVDFRALHLCIFRPDDGTDKESTDPESIKRMLRLAAMSGYQYVFLEFWGMFPYQRRPCAVWPNQLYPEAVVREIIRYAKQDLHITPLPAQNLSSHAGWSRMISRQHVVLDQGPELADMWIQGGWCFDTENPDTKAFLRDVIEELIEVYEYPPLFHTGCDKAFGFGFGGSQSADLLFGNHLGFLNAVLQEHGTRMVMWADMLYSSMDVLYWKASPSLVDMLSRNILMNIWTHNNPGVHWADVDFFENRGFQTIYSPFLDQKGIASMVRRCLKQPSYGILQTTWHRPQTACPSVVFSGAHQWQGFSPKNQSIDAFLARWYPSE